MQEARNWPIIEERSVNYPESEADMTRFEWQSKFNTGIKILDQQHKKLVSMINLLEDAIEHGNTQEAVGVVLKSLVHYASWHFAEEENMMLKLGYGELLSHKSLHKMFNKQLAEKLMALKEGQDVSAYEIISMIKKWFAKHIMIEDHKIGRAYRSQKAIPA